MSKPTNKTLRFIFIPVLIVTGFLLLLLKVDSLENNDSNNSTLGSTVSNVGGKQIIELKAKAGYFPASVVASANIDTILRVTTDSTFDCSSALSIPKLSIRKNLPPTATTDIFLGSQAPGSKLAGTCAMGMYNFSLSFN